MTQAIIDFFQGVGQRQWDPHLAKINGTIRFKIHDGDQTYYWLVTVEAGKVTISNDPGEEADAEIVADIDHLDRVVRGDAHAAPSMLRGDLLVRGDWRLIILMERLLPSPPGTRGPHLRRGAPT